jgi:AraC family transcriptional regulator of adaptative response/methylated-DNA-[protein]-cysteine methyltransferase
MTAAVRDDHVTRVAELLDHIDASRDTVPPAELAAVVGWHPDHLTRVFREHVGVSPTRYQQHLRAEAGRRLLQDRTVLDATIDLGASSPGRVHDLLVTVEAVTPGEARRGGSGVDARWDVHPTALGPLVAVTTERGVVQLGFAASTGTEDVLDDVRARWPEATLRREEGAGADAARRVNDALGGRPADTPLPLLLRGTNLQVAVWRALLRLPSDATIAYGELAAAAGHPRAVRAVASAVGRNPMAPLVPCHRVLRATGALGGYRWGLDTKRRLLAIEAARSAQRHAPD